jgi:superoxide reductase
MTTQTQIYKCEICGNIIEILHEGAGILICCNQDMKLQEENSEGEYAEKHAPVIENNLVKVGSVEHPMEEEHFIEWIEATCDKGFKIKAFLKPGQKPEAEFCFKPVSARMYCNKHGFWISK